MKLIELLVSKRFAQCFLRRIAGRVVHAEPDLLRALPERGDSGVATPRRHDEAAGGMTTWPASP